MTGDGRWQYTWDGENRLIEMSTGSVTVSFVYDGLGRRVSKTVTGLGTPVSVYYYWDGWELLADDSLVTGYLRTYLWNPAHPRGHRTLLGYRDGAESHNMAMQIATIDANGSVLYMTDSTTGAVTAQFEYGPFGESLRATGAKAATCPIRYSSEYWDAETELYYYGHRYYSPRLGRWLSKDPIEEQGGINLYGFVGNQSINKTDILGLAFYWFVDRDYADKARAIATEGAEISQLADATGLNLYEYKSWLSNSDGTEVTENLLGKKFRCRTEFKVPNTVLALWVYEHWDWAWGATRDQETAWKNNIINLRAKGYKVVSETYKYEDGDGQEYMLNTKIGKMTKDRILHGFLFWGHGNKTGLGAIKINMQEDILGKKYLLMYQKFNYYLSFGAVFACASNYGRSFLYNGYGGGHGWIGYDEVVNSRQIPPSKIDINGDIIY